MQQQTKPTIARSNSKHAGSKAADSVPFALAEGLLTPDEVARQLHVSRPTVYWLIRRGDLPCFHIGRALRVGAPDVRRYLEEIRAQ
jgi:excisionase family DNA binding protein